MRAVAGGIAVAAAGVASIVLGPSWLLGFALAASLLAAGELFRLARAQGLRPLAVVGHAGIAALVVTAHVRGERAPTALAGVVAAALGLAFVGALVRRDRRETTRAVIATMLPVVTVGLLASYVLATRAAERHGFRLALALAVMVVANEAGAWVVARVRPAAPAWWRAVAGGLATLGVAGVARATLSPPFSWPTALVLGLVVAAAAPVGARGIAMLRRDLETAHAPGGGILGALDGILAAAPVYFYAFRALVR